MPLRQCSGQALATAGRMPALHCNAFAQFVRRKPRDADDFIPAALAGGNGNGRSRHLQKFGEEFDASLICPAFDRRCGQGDFKGVAKFAGDGILLRTRMNSHRETDTVVGFMDCEHENFAVILSEAKDLCSRPIA